MTCVAQPQTVVPYFCVVACLSGISPQGTMYHEYHNLIDG